MRGRIASDMFNVQCAMCQGQDVFLHRCISCLLHAFFAASSRADTLEQSVGERMLTYAGACAGGGA